MAEQHELVQRVVVLESKFDHVVNAVDKLAKVVDGFAARPQQIAWREVATTAAVFLGLAAYVGNYLEGQYAKNIAVERYRLEQIEKKLCIAAAALCTK